MPLPMSRESPGSARAQLFLRVALYGLFVLSGAAGLIYESLWARYLALFVGHTAYAQILVLGVKGGLLYSGVVQPGEVFAFGGADKHKLDKEIVIVVDGRVNTRVHTSCSRPVHPGVVYGDFQIVAGVSAKGGLFCPEPVPSSPSRGSRGGSKGGSGGSGGSKGGSKGGSRGGSRR